VDIRLRWRAGQILLALALATAVLALLRPLAPGAPPWTRLGVTLLLGAGALASALLASLKGRRRPEQWAFYAFLLLALDGLTQILAPLGWPGWPLLALFVCALAVAEAAPVAFAGAFLAAALTIADAARASFEPWRPALAAAAGYAALVLAVQAAQRFERSRLEDALREVDRLRFGFDDDDPGRPAEKLGMTNLLERVSEQGRRALQKERAGELELLLQRLVQVARASLKAHSVLCFDIDRERGVARPRAWAGPEGLRTDRTVPLGEDPFAFVLERGVPFYATDFKRLLWELPYYAPGTQIGTLLAVPVLIADGVSAVLIADQVEIQSLSGDEPEILVGFAALCADAIEKTRAAVGREELGLEFHAVYRVSERLARATKAQTVRRILLDYARKLVAFEGAAFVMADERGTRYRVVEAHGWALAFEGREVSLMERTWAAWVLRGTDQSLLIEDLARDGERMPILVLDEDATGAEALLAVPLRVGLGDEEPAEDRDEQAGRPPAPGQRLNLIGAFLLTGKQGAFDATARRVLGLFSNQAAATLYHIALKERERNHAARDGLTGLYNRRAFDEMLRRTLAAEDRRGGGRFSLLLLDVDNFKKLNDTYGHPAGDAALRNIARTLQRVVRAADIPARHGGEEFAVIMPDTDEEGALKTGERLRHAIEKDELIFEGARIFSTASLGLAEWPRHGRELAELLAAADRALYAAKEAGRNRLVSASSLPAPDPDHS
jgi:diguanylate cyclase (GGDEF)-like protein